MFYRQGLSLNWLSKYAILAGQQATGICLHSPSARIISISRHTPVFSVSSKDSVRLSRLPTALYQPSHLPPLSHIFMGNLKNRTLMCSSDTDKIQLTVFQVFLRQRMLGLQVLGFLTCFPRWEEIKTQTSFVAFGFPTTLLLLLK